MLAMLSCQAIQGEADSATQAGGLTASELPNCMCSLRGNKRPGRPNKNNFVFCLLGGERPWCTVVAAPFVDQKRSVLASTQVALQPEAQKLLELRILGRPRTGTSPASDKTRGSIPVVLYVHFGIRCSKYTKYV